MANFFNFRPSRLNLQKQHRHLVKPNTPFRQSSVWGSPMDMIIVIMPKDFHPPE